MFPCGFCHNKIHKGFLIVQLLREKNYIEKDCHYLEKFEKHEFWIEKKMSKNKRELGKIVRKLHQDRIIDFDTYNRFDKELRMVHGFKELELFKEKIYSELGVTVKEG